MVVVYQRVSRAEVRVDGEVRARIGRGALLLVGVAVGDDSEIARWMAQKVAGLRLHEDAEGKLNLALKDVGGEVLAVSQFTLLGDARKGKRPSFVRAAGVDLAEPLFVRFVELLQQEGVPVKVGIFGAHMEVELVNDGPVTLILERGNGAPPGFPIRSGRIKA
jgi:D-tyrosyl-tRNA(Tyr) deacylase